MGSSKKIPLFQAIAFPIFVVLIAFRIGFNNSSIYVNVANYISMLIAIFSVSFATINKSIIDRRRNIFAGITVITMIGFTVLGVIAFLSRINISPVVNDIFTLIALLYCICSDVFEYLIVKIFALTFK